MGDEAAKNFARVAVIMYGLHRIEARQPLAMATMADAINNRSFETLCDNAGASTRTIERLFQRQVGTSFETWRRQARLMKAIELLVGGHSVKEAAHKVGYRQTGAFVTMFRDTFGKTPKAWITGLTNIR